VPAPGNIPGGKTELGKWVDGEGNFWMLGGQGQANTATSGVRGDFWRLAPITPPVPVQPGLYTTAKPGICGAESNVTYTIPAVAGATGYEWAYTGTNVTYTTSTTAPTNSLSFAANATGGGLRVRGVNGAGNGPWRDTTLTENPLTTATSTNSSNRTVSPGHRLLPRPRRRR